MKQSIVFLLKNKIAFVCSVYLHSANLFVLKAKRQLQKTSTSIGGEMNAVLFPVQWVFKHLLNEDKASGGCHRFLEELFELARKKSGRNYAEA
ncbi:hypothetical protein MKY34_19120 [Sporosarcina sp. FSL K6-1522]|uniref:hypothetical protein n=1 Tax=Sporosarcina sp. FSL K6-1522 TaxID=2921554 RepID=UPI00315B06DB